jgi:Tol biopolymer transport system component
MRRAVAISPGTRLGSYEVIAAIGVGGMGEVYRARDARLNRDVALKILPDAFAADADRVARFTREAQTLAALNHPNIAQIYGIEDGHDTRALVIELVDGPDLAQRIAQGPIPLDEALAIARQVADALESAHDHGIVHRDLKPANIKVRDDGTVKVLDFGLAKAYERSAPASTLSMSPTLASPAMTGVGMIIGTAAYMSPEQAKGKSVDKRADIWAFGVVLYEMLTGRTLFEGETVSEVLAAVIMREPDLATLPPAVPAHVRQLIGRCLVRDPKVRLRDIGEARLALAGLGSGVAVTPDLPAPAPAPGRTGASRWLLAATAVLAVALVATGAALWTAIATVPTRSVTRYEVRAPDKSALVLDSRPNVSLSPDGSLLVYVARVEGTSRLYVRTRADLVPRALPGTEAATNPAVSPDGRQIAFFAGGVLKRSSLDGAVSEVVRLSENTDGPRRGVTWLTNDTLVYSPLAVSGLFAVNASGGTPRMLTTLDEKKGERTHRWPTALPAGKAVIFTVGSLASPDNYDASTIEAVDVATGQRHVVLQGASSARYVATGHLLFARGASVYAVPFDIDRLTTTGTAVQVLQGVNGDSTTGALHFSVADDGTMAYTPGSMQAGSTRLMWLDRKGATRALSLPRGLFFDPRLSPDGTRVAVAWQTVSAGTSDIWVSDLTRNTFTRLTFGGNTATPVWSADGKTIYYSYIEPTGRRSTIMRKPADGSREAEAVVVLDGARAYIQVIDREQRWALVDHTPIGSVGDVMRVALTANAKPEPVVATTFDDLQATLSPNGRWLAYVSDETGRFEVYVRDMSTSGARWQLSTMGGEEPHWSGDGREIFYRNNSKLMSVSVEGQGALDPKTPIEVFDGVYDFRSDTGLSYAVDPKQDRFLMIQLTDDSAISSMVVVLNWFDELRRLTNTER